MIAGLVSVVVPFHDIDPAFLTEAIESVRAQTYDRWELLLVSDGVNGDCLSVAQKQAASAPSRIRVFTHPGARGVRRGPSATRNLGIAHARGEFVALLDADDVFLPHKLSDQVALLAPHPDVGMTYGRAEYWHSWSAATAERDFIPELGLRAPTIVDPPHLLPMYLEGTASVPPPCSVVARSSAVRAVGGFEATCQTLYEDQVFYAKMCLSTRILVSEGLWDRYRQHSSSQSRTLAARELEHRRAFLTWLEGLLHREQVRDDAVWKAVRRELWKLRHPHCARVLRTGRRLTRRVTRLVATTRGPAC